MINEYLVIYMLGFIHQVNPHHISIAVLTIELHIMFISDQAAIECYCVCCKASITFKVKEYRIDQCRIVVFVLQFVMIEGGILTNEKVIELLGCFLAKAAELLPLFFDRATEYFSGLSSASGITLGGISQDGEDGVNELSFLILIVKDHFVIF